MFALLRSLIAAVLAAPFMLLFAVLTLHAPPATAAEGDDVPRIVLIRHAEAGDTPDPALTATGVARADAWHGTLGAPPLARVYATDTRRSRETAGAIATDAGAEVELYDPARPAELVGRLRSRGEAAVVVAHSNTLPELAAALGVEDVQPVSDDEHGRVYRVVVAP